MTTPTDRTFPPSSFHASALASAALVCAGAMCCAPALARDTRETRATQVARAASKPRTDADALGSPPAPGQYAPAPPTDRAVYRCGSSYSARPCGASGPLDIGDERSASQRAQAADVAARDKRLARWLEAQRHERDAAASAPRKPPADPKACVPTRTVACPKPRRTPSQASKAKLKSGSGAIFPPSS